MKKNTAIFVTALLIFVGIIVIAYVFNKKSADNKNIQTAANNTNNLRILNLTANDIYTVKMIEFTNSINITGVLKPSKKIQIKAKNTGDIAGLNIKIGDTVRKGQILARINNSDINSKLAQTNAQIKIAQQQLKLAKTQYEKNVDLAKENFITQSGLDTYKTNLDTAQQNLNLALASHEINKKAIFDTDIIAPFSGIISAKNVENGEKAVIDSTIVEIIDNSILELEAGIGADEISNIKLGQKVKLYAEGINEAASGKIVGEISKIAPASMNNFRLINVYINVNNLDNKIKAGIFAKGSIILDSKELNAIPEYSIVRKPQQKPFVYVLSKNKIHKVEIQEEGYIKNNLIGIKNLDINTNIIAIPLPSDINIEKLSINIAN